jgi:hypothetical protein
VIGVVQVTEADRSLLNVLRTSLQRGEGQHRDEGGREPGIPCFHVFSEWEGVNVTALCSALLAAGTVGPLVARSDGNQTKDLTVSLRRTQFQF